MEIEPRSYLRDSARPNDSRSKGDQALSGSIHDLAQVNSAYGSNVLIFGPRYAPAQSVQMNRLNSLWQKNLIH